MRENDAIDLTVEHLESALPLYGTTCYHRMRKGDNCDIGDLLICYQPDALTPYLSKWDRARYPNPSVVYKVLSKEWFCGDIELFVEKLDPTKMPILNYNCDDYNLYIACRAQSPAFAQIISPIEEPHIYTMQCDKLNNEILKNHSI